jgi:Flp pilus assembly protein TadD
MRHYGLTALLIGGALVLSGCEQSGDEVSRALDSVNVIDESNLNDIMLSVADPNEAVSYFLKVSGEKPERIDLKRGLAQSLIRAQRPQEAALAWENVVAHKDATDEDKVEYADALIRTGDWAKAEQTLDIIPPTHETFRRYRLEAMIADANKEWDRADSFYETAVGLTTTPANVLNNWGFSKLTRGDFPAAERLFTEAITYDRDLFTAKNNLVLARSAQQNYTLPVIPMTKTEQAQMLHTAALSAIKQGNVDIGRTLLERAIDTHPQHFEPAVRALQALDTERT